MKFRSLAAFTCGYFYRKVLKVLIPVACRTITKAMVGDS